MAEKIPQVLTVELAIEDGTKSSHDVVRNHARRRQFVDQAVRV